MVSLRRKHSCGTRRRGGGQRSRLQQAIRGEANFSRGDYLKEALLEMASYSKTFD